VLNPAEANVDIELQYRPLITYLEDEVGVEIETTRASDYGATLSELERGTGDFADTSPSAAVAAREYADVVGLRKAFGSEQYFSLITTTPDSGIEELADLEGASIALGATLSVSGTLFPLYMLSQAGLDIGDAPQGDAVDFDVAGYTDHFTARDQLINRPEIDAAGTGAFTAAPHVPQEQFDEMSQEFVDISAEYDGAGEDDPQLDLLSVSQPIPRAPIMVRSDLDHPDREELEEAMLNAPDEAFQWDEEELADELGVDPDTEEGQAELENHLLWFDDIIEGDESDFEPVANLLDELGLEFGDLS
jgi:phosphonate transport system substrate-binding protein